MSLFHTPEACLQARQQGRIKIRRERRCDVFAREQLLDAAFGADRFAKSSERLRERRVPAGGLAFVALDRGRLVGTIRLWSITAGHDRPCLLLGPLAVAADAQNRGVGGALMHLALRKAASRRYNAVILVGDIGYYSRFGFSSETTGALHMPGLFERERLLACELVPGALEGARGLIAVNRPPRSRFSGIMDSVDCRAPAIPRMA
jgi:predicted N-acetyltransferase YhbS